MPDPFGEAAKELKQSQADPFGAAQKELHQEQEAREVDQVHQARQIGITSALEGLSYGLPGMSFLGSPVGRGVEKGGLSTALHTADLARRAAGAKPLLEQPETREMITPEGAGERTGFAGEQLAEFAIPIPGVSALKVAKAPGLLNLGKRLVAGGVDVGLKTAAQTGSPKEAATTAVIAGPIGGVAEVVVPGLGRMLNSWAKSQYAKVLHPLGRKAKEVAEEQIPKIVEQGYGPATAFTREGLEAKFKAKVDELGPKIAQEYQMLDQTTRTQLTPIYLDLARWMEQEVFTKGGAVKDPQLGEKALETWDYLQNVFGKYAKTAKPSEVWEIRQALDKYVYRNKLTADASVAAANQVKKAVGNMIRNQLNTQHPSVQALNNQFHMWRAAAELMQRNITNEVGKLQFARNTGIIGRFLMGATLGGGADVAGRRGEFNPWETGLAAALGGLAFESTGWRTVSAVTKAKIANQLMAGNGAAAADLAARAVGRIRAAGYQPPQEKQPEQTPVAGAPPAAPERPRSSRLERAIPQQRERLAPETAPLREKYSPLGSETSRAAPTPTSAGEVPTSAAAFYPNVQRWWGNFQRIGYSTGVPASLLAAVTQLESSGRENPPVGGSGERGLLQLMPATARALKVNPNDPQQSIRGAAHLLKRLMQKYRGETWKVLAAYNEGEPAFDRRQRRSPGVQSLPPVTRRYVNRGLKLLGQRGLPNLAQAALSR